MELMLKGGPANVPIFFVLNGLGLAFLLYVLVNFWKEGRRIDRPVRRHPPNGERSRDFEPIIVTHPISHTAQGGISVIPLRPIALGLEAGDTAVRRVGVDHRRVGMHHTVVEMPLSRISTNSAAESLPLRAKIAAKDGPQC
jgi:hypothetical protein